MKAIVFDTTAENCIINIPAKPRKGLSSRIHVILLPSDISVSHDKQSKRKENIEIIMKGGSGKSSENSIK